MCPSFSKMRKLFPCLRDLPQTPPPPDPTTSTPALSHSPSLYHPHSPQPIQIVQYTATPNPLTPPGGTYDDLTSQVSALSLSLSVEVAGRKRSEELLGSAMVRLESRLIGLDQEIHEWRMESGDKDEYMKKCHELEVENACLRSQNQMSGGVRQLERSYTVRLYHRSYS